MTHRDVSFIENPTAHDYAVAAEVTLRDGEPSRALELVAAALALDPGSSSLRSLLFAIDDAEPSLAIKAASAQPEFFGLVAAKSWLLARRGELVRACCGLLEVVRFRPEVAYLPWVLDWDPARVQLGRVEEVRALLFPVSDVLARGHADARRENALAFAALLGIWAEQCTEDPILSALLVRHLLSLEQLECAEAAALRQPRSWHREVSLARVAKQRGQLRAAITHYHEAARLDLTDHTALLDAGELELELGEAARAAGCFGQARERNSESSTARVAWLGARFAATRDPAAFEELRRLEGAGEPAEELREVLAFETWLPLPESPGAHALMGFCRRLVREGANSRKQAPVSFRVEVSEPEPPSLWLAFRAALEALGIPEESELRIVGANGALLEVEHPLFGGASAWFEQSARDVAPELIRAVMEIGVGAYAAEEWWRRARLWRQHHPDLDHEEMLRAMVRPPPCAKLSLAPPLFVFRFQVAAAMLWLAAPRPFLGSRRGELVDRLLMAPADWTGVAVALALSCVALDERAARPAIEERLAAALDPERKRPDWFVAMVARVWKRLPDLAPSRLAELRIWARLG